MPGMQILNNVGQLYISKAGMLRLGAQRTTCEGRNGFQRMPLQQFLVQFPHLHMLHAQVGNTVPTRATFANQLTWSGLALHM